MRILITGANGFIGASLSKHLIDQGHEVRGLVRETSDLSLLKDVALQYHVGSLKDFTSFPISLLINSSSNPSLFFILS